MELFAFIFVAAIVGVALKVGFWVLLAWRLFRAADAHQRAVEQSLGDFQALMGQARRYRGQGVALPPGLQSQVLAQVLRAQNELRQMDHIAQQRYETNVAGMLGSAASAGVDVSGLNW